jgi:Icc-related predicted phosphoesterase
MASEGSGFALIDPKFEAIAAQFEKMVRGKKKKLVLVTHAPPYGTELDRISDGHCGNKSIRNFILKIKPVYALSGHIHECNYKSGMLGTTKILNPGPEGRIITI